MKAETNGPSRAEARRAVEDADEMVARAKGELVAAMKYGRNELPATLAYYVVRLEEREQSAAAERVTLGKIAPEQLDAATAAARAATTRVSALVASHVMGLTLVRADSPHFPWRVRTAGGRLLEVPNFAGDVSAIVTAERRIDTDALRALYGAALLAETGQRTDASRDRLRVDVFAVACAPPAARARALLRVIGIDPASNPPVTET